MSNPVSHSSDAYGCRVGLAKVIQSLMLPCEEPRPLHNHHGWIGNPGTVVQHRCLQYLRLSNSGTTRQVGTRMLTPNMVALVGGSGR